MSRTIDEKVVEMRFDNKQFESNVATSMSTLEKLKRSLKLDGASKGLEDIDKASKKVDMSGLGGAVESVKVKFSALDVVAVTALANITNSAVNAGKQLIKSLSVDQITKGFEKFSDKTTSVATLVAQGNAIEDVNDQLDRLNWFTDETSYNFTEMVSNIAKFTATGKGLNESVTAMEGIATWAALSGQNAATASRAMYQLSQAMGAGTMRLEDFRSIQNASMDTEEFRKKCIEAAISLETLQDNGDGTYTSLVEGASGASWSIEQFASNLTSELWLTSDVMMKVFNEYSSAVEGIYDAADERGMLASEIIDEIHDKANELKKGTEATSEDIDNAIRELGYTLEDGSLQFDSFGLKAFEAAQKARTFQDAIDSVKDAVSTGWMNTFELIFGNANEATVFWTDIANMLWDIFAASGETRNQFLEFALNFAKPWEVIEAKLNGSIFGKIKDVAQSFENVTDQVQTAAEKLQYFQDVVNRVWNGDFNNHGDNPDRYDLLTKAGYDWRVVQDLVNKGYQYKLTIEDVEASHKKFGLTIGLVTEETKDATEATEEATIAFEDLTDEQLIQAGLTEEEIDLYRALEKEAKRLGISVSDLAEEMSTNDGRTLLLDSFKNSLQGIMDIGTVIKSAWKEIFNPPGIGEMAVKLYGIIKSLNEFSQKLILVDADTGELNETGQKLQRTFKGIFAIVDVVTTVLGGGLKIALKIISQILSYFHIDILDVTAAIGDALVKFDEWFKSLFDISGILDKIAPLIERAVGAIKKWFKSFKESEGIQNTIKYINNLINGVKEWWASLKDAEDLPKTIAEGIVNAFTSIPKIISTVFSNIRNAITSSFSGVDNPFGEFFDKLRYGLSIAGQTVIELGKIILEKINGVLTAHGFKEISLDAIRGLVNGLKEGAKNVWNAAVEIAKKLVQKVKDFLGIHSPSTVFMAIGSFIIAGLIVGILKGLPDSINAIKTVFNAIFNWIKSASGPMVDTLKKVGEGIANVFKSLWNYITDESGGIEWGKLFAGGSIVGLLVILKKFADVFSGVSDVLEGVEYLLNSTGKAVKSFSKVLNAVAFDINAKALQKLAIAVAILVASIWVLTKIDDPKKLREAAITVGILVGVLALLSVAMSKLSSVSVAVNDKTKKLDAKGLVNPILLIGLALLAVAAAVKIIGDMDPEKAKQGILGVAGVAAGLIVFLAIIGGISRYSGDVNGVGKMMIKIAVSLGIMAIVMKTVAKMDPEDIIIGIAVMEAFCLFVIQMGIANRIAGMFGDNFGGNVLKISIAMGIMVIVMKMMSKMDPEDIFVGIVVLQAFVILIGEMALINRLAGENVNKFGGAVMGMATSILILTSVLWLLSKMNKKDVENGLIVMQAFILVIAEMILASNLAGKESAKIAGNIMAMAAAIGILALISIMLSLIDTRSLIKGVAAIYTLGLVMSAMIYATKDTKDVKGNLITLVVAIGIMAAAVVALSFIDGIKLAGVVAALDSLMLCFTLMIAMTSKTKNTKGMRKTLLLMIGIISLLAGLVALLSLVDPKRAVPNALALSVLMLSFASFIKILNGVKLSKTVVDNLQSMVLVILELGVILSLMSLLPNPTNMIPSALAIGILLNTLATSMLIMSKTKGNYKMTLAQLQSMALVITEIAVILSLMSLLPNPMNMIRSAIAIGILLNALATAMLIMSKVKGNFKMTLGQLQSMVLVIAEIAVILSLMSFLPNPMNMIPSAIAIGILLNALATAMLIASFSGKNAAQAASAMVIMAIALAAVGLVLGIMSAFNVEPSIETALSLSVLMVALSVACLIVSSINVGAATQGALGLAAFIGIMAAVILAAGALSKIPGFNELLEDGGNTLGLVGAAIGKFIGGIVGGIASGVASALPAIGVALSEFMVGAMPFITLAKNIDASVVLGAGYITAAILALSYASFISGVMSILSLGQSSLVRLGIELSIFGKYVKVFADSIRGIDSEAISSANNVATMLLKLTASEFISAIVEKFGGSIDFSSMGKNLKTFGQAVVDFSDTISGKIDTSAVEAATAAGAMLVELNKSLPRSGGWLQDIIGEKDFKAFSEACREFANCILEINEIVSQEGFEIQSEKIEQLVTAGTQFSKLNNSLPRSGGIAQDFAGEKDLTRFGIACSAFVGCMIAINKSVSSDEFVVQSDKIAKIVTAGTQFSDLNKSLPRSGGIAQDFAGEKDLTRFGKACSAFADCMIEVNESLNKEGFFVNLKGMEDLKQAGIKMTELQNVLPKTGGWWQDVAGSKDIGDFGEKIETFGEAIVEFSDTSSNLNLSSIDSSISAANRIRYLIESLVGLDTSGLIAFTGIGPACAGAGGAAYQIAKTISEFSSQVAGISIEAVSVSVDAATKLKSMIYGLSGLDVSGIENFKVDTIADQMKTYSDKVSGIDTATISASVTNAERLKSLIAGLNILNTSGISNFNVSAIGEELKKYHGSISSVDMSKISSSISEATRLKSFVSSINNVNLAAVSSFKAAVDELSQVNMAGVIKAFTGSSSELETAGASVISSLVSGMRSKLSDINNIIRDIMSTINASVTTNLSAISTAGKEIAAKLAEGFSSNTKSITTSVSSGLTVAVSSISLSYTAFYNAGSYLVTGFCNGISDNSYKVAAKAKAMAEAAVEAAREALKINSPSKVFKAIGSGIPEGFAMGIGMLGGEVEKSVTGMASSAINTTRSAMANVLDALNNDMDTQPRIRPVVDLSNVQTGVNAINGMFDGVQTVGISSSFNAINASMNRKLQNGTNDDVVSAINKLRVGLDNNRGDTYNFGDFTYDSGSEVADAVGTLIRYARIGRRV